MKKKHKEQFNYVIEKVKSYKTLPLHQETVLKAIGLLLIIRDYPKGIDKPKE